MNYDHEAFLGEKEAKTFDQLTPEESKERLGKIVDKIDVDQDGLVTLEELKQWILTSQKSYIVEDIERQWKSHNPDEKESILWEEYKKSSYGFLDEPDNGISKEDVQIYQNMINRDKRRWDLADLDQDQALTKAEFANFLHPEESEHMRDVVVDETLEDVDKDKDGKVSLDEYINDIYASDAAGNDVPDWIHVEKEQFSNHRDKDKDGFMDKDEVRDWVLPQDFDQSEAEAKHLINEADADKVSCIQMSHLNRNAHFFVFLFLM